MKKLFFMLITLFTLYLCFQLAFTLFSKGSDNEYIITDGNKDFEILESSYFSNNKNTYSYTIKANNTFNFQINYNYNKLSNVLTEIKYYNDNTYECILPIFKNDLILMDMICYDNNKYTYYYNLKGKNKNLDDFISKIDKYDVNNYIDNTKYETIEGIKIYKDNLIQNHYISIQNEKGIYDISKNFNSVIYNISLYTNEIKNPKISALVDEYYIVADYNKQDTFNKFNIVNLKKLKTESFNSDYNISLNSYIQGVVDGKVYIYDKDNKIQYEFNVSKQIIIPYSGDNIKFYNGSWTTMSINDANKELEFTNNDLNDENYTRIDKVGNEVGYYYLYKYNGKSYDVYRRDIQNENTLIYLFNTKTINNIYYLDDYIYFANDNLIQVYNNLFGVKNVFEYPVLNTKTNFKLNVYRG